MKMKLLLIALVVTGTGSSLLAARNSVTVSVRSEADPSYRREKLPDGSWKPETYVLADAKAFPGTVRDGDIEKVPYPTLAGVIAQNLAAQNYFLGKTAADADLLLVVHWGTTIPFNDLSLSTNINLVAQALSTMKAAQAPGPTLAAQIIGGAAIAPRRPEEQEPDAMTAAVFHLNSEYRYRDLLNTRNAKLLGYLDEINDRDTPARWAGAGTAFDDLMSDIEEARYYIVIGAYDLHEVRKSGRKVLKWVTRISMAQQGNEFDEKFASMLATAKPYFGQDSGGLRRKYRPDARVDLGELKFLGEVYVPSEKK